VDDAHGGRPLRALYLDLDRTLLGPDRSIVRNGEGLFTTAGIRALELADEAGVDVVLMSGRRHDRLSENARLLGVKSYIGEAGGVLVSEGERRFLTDPLRPGALSVVEQIEATGAPRLLLDAFAASLQVDSGGAARRLVGFPLRGKVELAAAAQVLDANGLGYLRLDDNGIASSQRGSLDLAVLRSYQLVPAGTSKAAAVAVHMGLAQLDRYETAAIGDSPADVAVGREVGSVWVVANGVGEDPEVARALGGLANGHVTRASFGEGVLEALRALV
jgi:phosphoglycolate phosphatase